MDKLLSLVAAIMVTFDTSKVTRRAVESLFAYYPGLRLILVDNNSTDGSRVWLREFGRRLDNMTVLYMRRNLTHGPALHMGIVKARAPYVLTLDSDIKVLKGGFIEPMVRAFRKDSKLFVMGPKSTSDITGTRKGAYPIVHPAVMMMSRAKYLKGRAFRQAGQPVALAMQDARRRGDHLKSFPVWDYVKHYGGATRSVVSGRVLRARARKKSKK